jgi:beta-phosphoglucomutase-like phosphatase (HAD superfamily)
LIKEREAHNQTKTDLENIISDLKQQIDILQAPPKRKKAVKELTNTLDLAEIVQQTVSSDLVKDGGSF